MAYRREKIRREGNENIVVFDAEDDGQSGKSLAFSADGGRAKCLFECSGYETGVIEKIVEEARSRNKRSFTKDILIEQSDSMRIYAYEIEKYVMRINSLQDYFDASMALLHPQVRQELFPAERPVLTRVRDQVPAKYGLGAIVKNSLVADGCIIEGTVEIRLFSAAQRLAAAL